MSNISFCDAVKLNRGGLWAIAQSHPFPDRASSSVSHLGGTAHLSVTQSAAERDSDDDLEHTEVWDVACAPSVLSSLAQSPRTGCRPLHLPPQLELPHCFLCPVCQ